MNDMETGHVYRWENTSKYITMTTKNLETCQAKWD